MPRQGGIVERDDAWWNHAMFPREGGGPESRASTRGILDPRLRGGAGQTEIVPLWTSPLNGDPA